MSAFLVNFFIIILSLSMVLFLLLTTRSIQLERRISRFALTSINEFETSIIDCIFRLIWVLIYRFSEILQKNRIIINYAVRYEKYLSYKNNSLKKGTDILAMKILLGLFLFILNTFVGVFQEGLFNLLTSGVLLVASFVFIEAFYSFSLKKEQKKIENDLLQAVIIINNSLKIGKNINQALTDVVNNSKGIIKNEFARILKDLSYGVNIESAFSKFLTDLKMEELKYIKMNLKIADISGGNIKSAFNQIEKYLIDKMTLKNELSSICRQTIFLYRFLLIIPIIFILLILFINASYFKVLYTTIFGGFIILIVIALYLLYIALISKIMRRVYL